MRFLSIVLLVLAGVAAWLVYDGDRSLKQPLNLSGDKTLEVPNGANLKTLARQLQADGVIERAEYLYGYARFKKLANRIKAGEYALDASMSGYDLLALLVQGKAVQYRLTLVEGWNMQQVRAALAAAERLQDDIGDKSDQQVLSALQLDQRYSLPEGLFMPDTYHYTAGDTASSLLSRAQSAMAAYLEQAWQTRDPKSPIKTPYEALILASIVEKETGVASERATISGVFSRRLNKGMRLQTDPTVIYGIGPDFDGDIRRKDLTTDTPYNTYTRHGLPPTPIALAGREAVDAALHPEAGSSLYFVAKAMAVISFRYVGRARGGGTKVPAESLMAGVFLTLEGLEGTGKTTNMAFVADQLQAAGVQVLRTREPGGTPLGEALRDIILNRQDVQIGAMAELLMIFAARAQHIEQVILPALEQGKWVLSDRFTEASYAYQGAGRLLGSEAVASVESLVQDQLQPDLTILLDIDPALGLQRASATGAPDRIEQAGLAFFERVRSGYLARAEQFSQRFCVVDASEPLSVVQHKIDQSLQQLLRAKGVLS